MFVSYVNVRIFVGYVNIHRFGGPTKTISLYSSISRNIRKIEEDPLFSCSARFHSQYGGHSVMPHQYRPATLISFSWEPMPPSHI
jgi:hypothetical protein